MKKFLDAFRLGLGLVAIAEEAVPIGGQGKAKLDFVVGASAAVLEASDELRAAWKDPAHFSAAVVKAVTLGVALKNAAGVFQKGK